MKNRKLIFIGLFIFLSVVIGSFIYFPKSDPDAMTSNLLSNAQNLREVIAS